MSESASRLASDYALMLRELADECEARAAHGDAALRGTKGAIARLELRDAARLRALADRLPALLAAAMRVAELEKEAASFRLTTAEWGILNVAANRQDDEALRQRVYEIANRLSPPRIIGEHHEERVADPDQDAARLDWLEAHPRACLADGWLYAESGRDGPEPPCWEGPTVRAAIDAARRAAAEECRK